MEKFQTSDIPKSPRIQKLVDALYEHMPVIESARAKLITESYKETEGEPIITRRAKAFAHILHNIPIIIRDNELIVGSSTIAPRIVLLISHLDHGFHIFHLCNQILIGLHVIFHVF